MAREFHLRGIVGGGLKIASFAEEDAVLVARLRPLTRDFRLSLGDRACLALAMRQNVPVLTADRSWQRLKLTGVRISAIR